jgi:sulfur carrier protein ThiS
MKITVKLGGTLKKWTPEGGKLELAEGSTLADILAVLDIPNERILALSLNGEIEGDLARVLQPGDDLMVLPPVAGG